MKNEEIREKLEEILATQEISKDTSEIEYASEDIFQLFDKIMHPKKDYGIITKDVKTANLDKTNAMKVTILKSIAKDFVIFSDAFDLKNDVWIDATKNSIDADAEVMCAVSQGYLAKLLETFVTAKKESRIISKIEGEKKGLIFR